MVVEGTEILTEDGWFPIKPFSIPDNAYSEGVLKNVRIEALGKKPVWTYQIAPFHNTNQNPISFQAPRPCCFNLANGDVTYDLRPKDVLKANGFDCGYDASMWAQGFMKRFDILSLDGLDPTKYPRYRDRLEALKTQGEIRATDGTPPYGKTPTEIGSFIKGYLAADGHKGKFATPNVELFRFFLAYHGYAGLVLTGSERTTRKVLKVNRIAEFYDFHEITYAKGHDFQGFRVIDRQGPLEAVDIYKVYLDGSYVTKGGWTVVGD